jgi:hypothetical protein
VGDPEAFITAAAGIFAKYPDQVVTAAVSGPDGIPTRTSRVTLEIIKKVCEELNEPFVRAAEHEAVRNQPLLLPRPPRTAEEQARIDAQVASAREKLGIPVGGFTPRPYVEKLADGDGKHSERIAADIADRRARNSSR